MAQPLDAIKDPKPQPQPNPVLTAHKSDRGLILFCHRAKPQISLPKMHPILGKAGAYIKKDLCLTGRDDDACDIGLIFGAVVAMDCHPHIGALPAAFALTDESADIFGVFAVRQFVVK